MSVIPILFCIDVEPDERFAADRASTLWQGFEAAYAYLTPLRKTLQDATGSPVRFNWFFRVDPEVEHIYGRVTWPLEHYASYLRDFMARNDGIGLHTHAYRRDSTRGWVIDHGNQPWIDHCLRVSFEGFEAVLGRPCHTFRFGDRFMNNATMAELERLGVRYDMTAEPGTRAVAALNLTEPHTGSIPSYEGMEHQPYAPAHEDFRKPGTPRSRTVTVIPMSSAFLPAEWFPEPWHAPVTRRLLRSWGRRIERTRPHETANLARPHRHVRYVVEHMLETLDRPYLALVIRSSTARKARLRPEMEASLRYLTEHPRVREFVFTTPPEALHLLGEVE